MNALGESQPAAKPATAAWLTLIVLGALWLVLIRQLGAQWSVYPQYHYGWSVPFLVLYLLWQRWISRPEFVAAEKPFRSFVIAAILALTWFPTRLIQEANPIWRFASWSMAIEVTGITLCVIYYAMGRRGLKHFAFPILFFLVAVPWPSPLENLLIQSFTRWNVAATVAALGGWGIAAFPHGSVIEVSTGMVGIDEACSGVRSFQVTMMLALLLGEVYRLNAGRRLALIAGGVALAFVSNLARTFLLVWICARHDLAEMERWHDPAGTTILVLCFCGQWLLAFCLRNRTAIAATQKPPIASAHFPPGWTLLALGIWLLLAEGATQAWYLAHEQPSGLSQQWSVRWPADQPQFKELPISSTVHEQLLFNEGQSAGWWQENGSHWQAYFFRWNPARTLTERIGIQFAKSHRPEICLPATGMVLRRDLGIKELTVNQVKLPFHNYFFEDRGLPLHVFFCVWEDGSQGGEFGNTRQDPRDRLRAVLTGNRSLGQRELEIAVWGIADDQEAEAALAGQLRRMIVAK